MSDAAAWALITYTLGVLLLALALLVVVAT